MAQGSGEIAIIAVTRGGAALAARLAEALGADALLPTKFAEAGTARRCACYSGSVLEEIRRCWGRYRALVLIMASGVAVRAIAPLLGGKSSDPAVICLDEAGRWVIPLLGGHQAGANQLAQQVAALTGGQASITTASDSQGKPALDLLGRALGWRIDAASALTHASACLVNDEPIGVWVHYDLPAYAIVEELLAQADNVTLVDSLDALHGDAYAAGLIISHWELEPKHAALIQKSVIYRPPVLVVGMGCRRGVPLDELRAGLDATFADVGLARASITALATVDLKADEPGLRALAEELGVPLRIVPRDVLAALDPAEFSPSAAQVKFGLAGVAEPCALLVSGGLLILPKYSYARCTVAVGLIDDGRRTTDDGRRTTDDGRRTTDDDGPGSVVDGQRSAVGGQWSVVSGRLCLIGIGPGDPQQITGAALAALRAAEVVVGYKFYIEQVRPLLGAGQELIASPIGDEVARAEQAIDLATAGRRVALISSGDIGIYAMAGPVFEALRQRGWQGGDPEIVVLPGISAMQAVSARLGAALAHDFCTISLSDLLTPWPAIERRLWAAARGDFVVALYNPRSRERDWQLGRALEILRTYRPATTPVAIARNATRPDETIALTTLADIDPASVDMFTLVLVGNSQSYVVGGRMATPRGYTTEKRDSESLTRRREGAKESIVERDRDSESLTRRREDAKESIAKRESTSAELYPIALTQLRGAPVLVVGGGAVGERKVRGLLAAGAAVRLISPDATAGLRALAQDGAIDWQMRVYQADDLSAAGPLPRLVFAATSDRATNAQLAHDAGALGLLCNIADDPGASTFHLPAVHRGAGLTVAVSTAGESPARAVQVRDVLAAFLEEQTREPL